MSKVNERFSEKVSNKIFTETIELNEVIKLKVHPLRHTFLVNGATILMSEGESPGNFHVNIEKVIFKNRYERGYSLQMKGSSVNLPLPFPRMFTKGQLTELGQVKEEAS
jgi:hypothetical protein